MARIKKIVCVRGVILLMGLSGGIAGWNACAGAAEMASAALTERQDYSSSTGNSRESGSVSIYTDPATGDTVTDVIAPQPRQQERQTTPIYVYPEVTPEWFPQGGSGGGGHLPSPPQWNGNRPYPLPPGSGKPMPR